MINESPGNNRNPKSKKPNLESSGINIPDYAIERMAKCLLPIMRTFFESEEGQAELKAWEEEPDPVAPGPQRILCKRFSTKSRISHYQCAGWGLIPLVYISPGRLGWYARRYGVNAAPVARES